MKKLAKKLLLLFISIQFVACEGSLEPHLYGVVDTGNAFNTPADLSAATASLQRLPFIMNYAKKAGDLICFVMEVLL